MASIKDPHCAQQPKYPPIIHVEALKHAEQPLQPAKFYVLDAPYYAAPKHSKQPYQNGHKNQSSHANTRTEQGLQRLKTSKSEEKRNEHQTYK